MKNAKHTYIKHLISGFGNSAGDVVKIVHETDGEVYYYDEFRRYCYVNKSEEGVGFVYVQKNKSKPTKRKAS